jgi:hypothetical protein
VFSSLTASFETGFEFTFSRGNDEDGDIGLRGTTNHAGNICLVARGVQDRVPSDVSFKVCSTDFDGFTLGK